MIPMRAGVRIKDRDHPRHGETGVSVARPEDPALVETHTVVQLDAEPGESGLRTFENSQLEVL